MTDCRLLARSNFSQTGGFVNISASVPTRSPPPLPLSPFPLELDPPTIAKVFYDWFANVVAPIGIPPAKIDEFRNRDGKISTIRVDSKVVHETDTGEAKSDESRWMRLTPDTVGKTDWPSDRQGGPIFPEG